MLILSRVCADFRNAHGQVIFRISPDRRLSILDAPEEIRSDPLFDMLLAEGSLEAVQSVSRQKELEADPVRGTDASGKRKTPKAGNVPEPDEKTASPSGAGDPPDAPGNGPENPDDSQPAAGADAPVIAGSDGTVSAAGRRKVKP